MGCMVSMVGVGSCSTCRSGKLHGSKLTGREVEWVHFMGGGHVLVNECVTQWLSLVTDTGVRLVRVKSCARRLVQHCLGKTLVQVTGRQGALLGTR